MRWLLCTKGGSISTKRSCTSSRENCSDSRHKVGRAAKAEAEACFCQAIETSCRQRAKSLELRAVMSLARLPQGQGKKEEAWQMLEETYSWFTEGFDTKDL
jgi:predicted ATPase